jgi:beta-phosphoglucomutase
MRAHGFIFDMDGVIVDSNPYHRISLKQFCEKYGHYLSDEDLLTKIYGRTNKEWITNVFGVLPPEQLHQYAEEKEALYRQLHEKDMVPLSGLRQFLILLDEQKFPKAIGTSAPMTNVEFILRKTGLIGFFDIILKDTDISNGKPHPEIYLKAAERLGLAPDHCIVLEDSLSGIAAGQAAGCKVIGVATTHTPLELAHTDFVISDFEGLNPLELVTSLFGNKL